MFQFREFKVGKVNPLKNLILWSQIILDIFFPNSSYIFPFYILMIIRDDHFEYIK